MGNQPNDQHQQSVNFLLEEYRHFTNSFWRNEEVGEKRVNFFITLVTAVMAGLVALATKTEVYVYPIAVFALAGLLFFGRITLKRMIQRDTVTDEYKVAMDIIRSCFRDWGDRLQNYQPLGKGFKKTIDSTFKEDLQNGEDISGDLRYELEEKKILGCQNIRVKRIGSCHLIADKNKKRKYIILEEGQKLQIYDAGKTRRLETGGLTAMVVVINSLIVGGLVGLVTVWAFHLLRWLSIYPFGFDGCMVIGIMLGIVLGLLGFFVAWRKLEKEVENRYDKWWESERD